MAGSGAMTHTLIARIRHRIWAHQLPKLFTITDFAADGVRFEASTPIELYRIVNHGYEPDYLAAMLNTLEADDVLYDIGANIGLVALHAARTCRTIAFEPDPSFSARLQRNLELNPDIAVDVQAVAISDHDGTVTLYTDGATGASPSLMRQRGERGAVKVAARTLDALVADLPLPTVLKLDIEGAEVLALRGAQSVLNAPAAPRALFLEVHDDMLPGFGSSAEEVLDFVYTAGYRAVLYEAKRDGQQHLILGR